MKKIITALALTAAMISPAWAADEETCQYVKKVAESVMEARLIGVDVTDMMNVADSYSGRDAALQRMLVKDAYNDFSYSTPEYQKKAIQEFGTKHYLNCIK